MSTTRIADLPNGGNGGEDFTNNPANTYKPINVHPNPYGYEDAISNVSKSNPNVPSPPQNTSDNMNKQPQFLEQPRDLLRNQQEQSRTMPSHVTLNNDTNLTLEQINMIQNTPQQKIPSRDIYIPKTNYTQDEVTIPNYIPPTTTTHRREQDYVKEHMIDNEKKRQAKIKNKNQSEFFDRIVEIIQFPAMISILFFIFQYPLLDKLIFRRLNSETLVLYGSDGNMNIYGNAAKSLLFGICVYSIMKTVDYISSI